MATDTKLLPLPEKVEVDKHLPTGVRIYAYDATTLKNYARANIAHATAAKDAEIERLAEEANRQESLKEKYIIQSDGWEHRCKAAEIEIEALRADLADYMRIANTEATRAERLKEVLLAVEAALADII